MRVLVKEGEKAVQINVKHMDVTENSIQFYMTDQESLHKLYITIPNCQIIPLKDAMLVSIFYSSDISVQVTTAPRGVWLPIPLSEEDKKYVEENGYHGGTISNNNDFQYFYID